MVKGGDRPGRGGVGSVGKKCAGFDGHAVDERLTVAAVMGGVAHETRANPVKRGRMAAGNGGGRGVV